MQDIEKSVDEVLDPNSPGYHYGGTAPVSDGHIGTSAPSNSLDSESTEPPSGRGDTR